MEKIEEFTEFFASTALYAELNKQYTSFEVFEVNNGVFEIAEVQTAYQRYLKDTSTQQKRDQFSKDLNRMISDDYVLVPKRCSNTMAQACADYAREYLQENGGFNPWGMWRAMCEQALKETEQTKQGKTA